MDYRLIKKGHIKYIECISAQTPLNTEQDALDLIAACMGNDTYLLLLHGNVLAEGFFDLRSGLAGKVLQKLTNYRVQTAVIITSELELKSKFKEMLAELNQGKYFRVFDNMADAERWLLDSN